jgi:hypothetical protein
MAPKTLTIALAAFMTTLVACDGEGTENVGPRGGVVTSPDGKLVVDVPAGALDRDVFVTIGEVEDCADDLDRCYEIEPFGTMLSIPAKLTYYYDIDDLSRVAEEDLAIVGRRGGGWGRLADRQVDLEEGSVTATTMSFSSYTISAGL